MSDEKKSKEPISFEDLGGKKVGHHLPVQTEKPIDFSDLGGKRVGQHIAPGVPVPYLGTVKEA